MKRFSEQLKKKANTVKLKAAERADLRERLVSYMEYHPLPQEVRTKAPAGKMAGEAFTTVAINWLYVRNALGTLMLFLVIGVPFAAERTVPGDVLYPVKVSFNEEVRSTLTLSPYEKVEWETQRLERRVAEARLLASEGKLTVEAEADFAQAVKEHTDAAAAGIASINESDTDEAAIAQITFASALEVQSDVLEGFIASDETSSTTQGHSVVALAGVIGEARESAVVAAGEGSPSGEKLLARIEIETTRAYEYFDTINGVASQEEKTDINRRLKDIERKVAQALESQEGEEARKNMLLTTALTDTRKLISFMTNIDVRENVTIEELVPVSFTDEERTAAVAQTLEEVKDLKKALEARVSLVEGAVLEKVLRGLKQIDAAMTKAEAASDKEDITTAEAHSAEALAIATDLNILTTMAIGTEVPPTPPQTEATTTATTTEEVSVEGTGATTTASTTATTTEEEVQTELEF